MKFALLLGTLGFSAACFAQTAAQSIPGHPPVPGHPEVPGHPATKSADGAVVPYKFSGIPAPAMPRPSAAASNEGTVVSTQTSGGYSYIEVTSPSGNVWLAAPVSSVTVGERIRYENGAVMRNFTSKALGRTFATINFVGGISPAGSGAPASAAPAAAAAAPASTEGVVISAQDAGGYSYIELKGGDKNVWLAAPMTALKAGDKVRYEPGAVMHNFSSRSLNRTFPEIVFVDRVAIVTGN